MHENHSDKLLKVYLPKVPKEITTAKSNDLANQLILRNICECLTYLDPESGVKLNLLESSLVSNDGLTYRIAIHKNRYFHGGEEIIADDVIQILHDIALNDHSISQLGKYIYCKDTPWIKKLSRYRFEIRLKHKLPDLLERLSLTECAIRSKSNGSYSGAWQIAHAENGQILLKKNPYYQGRSDAYYNEVMILEFNQQDDFQFHLENSPYLVIYPGIYQRTKSTYNILDESCKNLGGGYIYYLLWHSKSEETKNLQLAIQKAFNKAITHFDSFHTRRTDSLFPPRHKFHVPLPYLTPRPKMVDTDVTILLEEEFIPERVLEKIIINAKEDHVNLNFVNKSSAQDEHNYPKYSGIIRRYFIENRGDIYTPVAHFYRNFADKKLPSDNTIKVLKKSWMENDAKRKIQNFMDFCRLLIPGHSLIPLLYTPIMLQSNRQVNPSKDGELIRFSNVQKSAHQKREDLLKQKSLIAIGSAVQMFVHDIKKPLSMIQGMISLIESTDGSQRVLELLNRHIPQIKKSMASANGLIQDIVEIGSNIKPYREPFELEKIVIMALEEILGLRQNTDIQFSYDFKHKKMVDVDRYKILRVFSNIILNACQAMNDKGMISFITQEITWNNRSFIEVCIRNTGSYIAPEAIDSLFEVFFTRGKKSGTGLGLAIAKKIITDHSGRIWCSSSKEDGTYFHFLLPIFGKHNQKKYILPSHSKDFIDLGVIGKDYNGKGATAASREEQPLPPPHKTQTLLIVDDEPIYLDLLREMIQSAGATEADKFTIYSAYQSDEAIEIVRKKQLDIIIIDVDLGKSSLNGFETVKEIRKINTEVKICIHSNGGIFQYQGESLRVGADLFLPKPMTKEHLVNLIAEASAKSEPPASKKHIIIVDDDFIFLEAFESLGEFEYKTFSSPDEFEVLLLEDNSLIEKALCIVTDYKFGNLSTKNGIDFARKIRTIKQNLPIFLATDMPMMEKLPDCIDKVISKNPIEGLAEIKAWFENGGK